MKDVKVREDRIEDVSIYWINLRERDSTGILDKKH
jgi:hypothetical protein